MRTKFQIPIAGLLLLMTGWVLLPITLAAQSAFTKITAGPLVTDSEASCSGAWGDFDGDGLLDVFVANSAARSGGARNSLYRNLGGDQFVRVTNAITSRVGVTWGGLWGDYNNDDSLDLFVPHSFGTNLATVKNELFRNDGGGTFTPVSNALTARAAHYTDASWIDHDGDGWLDLFVAVQSRNGSAPNDFCFRNLGDGQFQAWTTNEVGSVVNDQASTYGLAWCDYDSDGELELYVVNYYGPGFLYDRVHGSLRMARSTAGSLPSQRPTLCATWADFNNDGWFDLLTVAENGPVALHLNGGNGKFDDVTAAAGLSWSGTASAFAVGDYDNDGDLDLYLPNFDGDDVLFVNQGNTSFIPVDIGSPLSEGVHDEVFGWVDYNNDGWLDLFKACGDLNRVPNLLYRNSLKEAGNTNHWLKVQLQGAASNRSGIGARVWVTAMMGGKQVRQVRQIMSSLYGDGNMGGPLAHFGLGDAVMVDLIRIEWPSGNVQELTGLASDHLRTVIEPSLITPARPSASLNGAVTLTRAPVSAATYRWRFNGVDLTGQTNRILTLSNLVANQEGRYSVIASNATTLMTNFVYLRVDTNFTVITEGPVVTDRESSWGCNWVDYDSDGNVDLFVCNGSEAAGLERNALYRNQTGPDGTHAFTRVSSTEAGAIVGDLGKHWGAAWCDADNDGRMDAVVCGTQAVFYRNTGNGFFERRSMAGLGLRPMIGGIPCWGDANGDGLVDLFLGTGYVNYGAATNVLWINRGNLTFGLDTSLNPIVTERGLTTEGAAWGDYDGDGRLDLVVADYPGTCHVYQNLGGGRFARVILGDVGTDSGSQLVPAWVDYDNDAQMDLWVTSYNLPGLLYHNNGDGTFTKRLMGGGSESCQPAWADYDNDGYLDLFLSRGQGTNVTSQLWRNNGDGTFTPVTLGSLVNDLGKSICAAWGDYDNDGFLDLFVARTRGGANALYHNNGNANRWLVVKLVGTASNASAIGAKVRAYAQVGGKLTWQMREISGGNRAQNDLRAHFGLGSTTKVNQLRVEWPSGTAEEFTDVAAGQFLTIVEPSLRGAFTADGKFHLTVLGNTNKNYTVESSADLLQGWSVLETVTGRGLTPVEVIDQTVPTAGQRFYRLRSE